MVASLCTSSARAAEPAPKDPATRPVYTSKELSIGGYVHADWVAFRQSSESQLNGSTGEPLNEDRFLLRRGRIRLESDQGLVHGAFELDANTLSGLQVRPFNAEVSVKWPESMAYRGPAESAQSSATGAFFIVSTGLLMTPFGFDVPERENVRPFLERSTMSNELFPQSYDLGFRALGGYKDINYAFAILNGDPIGERAFPGKDPDKSKDLVFRVGTSTEVFRGLRIDAGFSGLTGRGFHAGTPSTKDEVVWRDENGNGAVDVPELNVLPGAPATPSQGFQRFALGGDVRLHFVFPVLGELTLRGELIRAKNLDRGLFAADPVAAARDLRELGYCIGGSQELTRWASIGIRHDLYDPDADAEDQKPFVRVPRDASRGTWTFMATARWNKARLIAEFDHRTNSLGREPSGAPTRLADDSFTLRAVLGF
jgi:hypothetical protein